MPQTLGSLGIVRRGWGPTCSENSEMRMKSLVNLANEVLAQGLRSFCGWSGMLNSLGRAQGSGSVTKYSSSLVNATTSGDPIIVVMLRKA